jgi:two-component system phosphate regulon response regulator PhoB
MSRRILLVEDDRYLRRACEVSLRQRGFAVAVAVDGQEALDRVREARPDLILLDLLMPRMNGIEVLRSLRAQEPTRDIPVLILSNSSREQDAEEIRTLGITDYLVKANLSLQELGDRVTRLLEG